MTTKSGYQKALKIACIIEIVLAVLALIASVGMSALGFAGLAANAPEMASVQGTVNGVEISGNTAAGILGVMGIVIAVICIFDIIVACLGIRGANNPAKIKPFYWLVVIGLALQVISLVVSFMNGGDATVGLSVVYNFLLLFLATRIKKEAGI